jgi:hypothetical protein
MMVSFILILQALSAYLSSMDEDDSKRQSDFRRASDSLNDHLMSPEGMLEPAFSIFGKSTATWETGSTSSEVQIVHGEGDDPEYFDIIDEHGGYGSEDEAGEDNAADEVVNDCGPMFDQVSGTFRSSDEELRHYACTQPFNHLHAAQCARGNRGKCLHGERCCAKMEFGEIWEMRSNFWKFANQRAPTSSERSEQIMEMLKVFLDDVTMQFNFSVMKSSGQRVHVCERAFMALLGYRSQSSQWRRCKEKVRHFARQNMVHEVSTPHVPQSKSKPKFENAKAWIRQYAINCSNQLLHHGQLNREGERIETDLDMVTIKSVPFESIKDFHKFYLDDLPEGMPRAERDCFQRAFESFSRTSLRNEGFVVRLRRCKQNFSTCDICNNADVLLQDKARKWDVGQREILRSYLKTHQDIQFDERQAEIDAVLRARTLDSMGQPRECFTLFDGFSVHKGVTPKWGKGVFGGKSHTQKEEPKVQNRIIAGIVICGHIDTIFVYSVDQMMSGGANLMIEVMRRALGDLGELLKGRNQMVPRILYLQFDNCGENKNKYMMAWCSMLVESKRYLLMMHTDHWFDFFSSQI